MAKSPDGKLALHLAIKPSQLIPGNDFELKAKLKNLTGKPIPIIRPFGDKVGARRKQLIIRNRQGEKLKYAGPKALYVIGDGAFTTLAPGKTVTDTLKLPVILHADFAKSGTYMITLEYTYDGRWDFVAKAAGLATDIWEGKIRSNPVTVRVLQHKGAS